MKQQSFGKNEDPMKDDDFMRKLGALKWKGETPAWLNIDLMNRGAQESEGQNIQNLQKEIETLKIEKADLAVIFFKFI